MARPLTVWRAQDPIERALAPGVSGNFEGGTYEGWTARGAAFGTRPASRTELGKLDGMQGNCAASSRSSGGDGALESAPFVLDAPRVTLLVAGGPGSYVRALQGDDEIARVQPVATEALAPKSLELDARVGQTIRLEIVD